MMVQRDGFLPPITVPTAPTWWHGGRWTFPQWFLSSHWGLLLLSTFRKAVYQENTLGGLSSGVTAGMNSGCTWELLSSLRFLARCNFAAKM